MSPSRPPDGGGRPNPGGDAAQPNQPVVCPHCGSTDVELEAAFGSQLMTSQYWCRACRTVFERMKLEPDDAPGGWLES